MFCVITGERPYHCGACGQRYTQGHQVSHVLCHCRGMPLPLQGVWTALHPGPPSPTCSLSLQGNAPTTADSVTPRATKSHMFSVIAGERHYHCRACGQRYTHGHQVSHVLCHCRGTPLPLRGVRTALHPGPPSPTCSLSLQGNAPTTAGRVDSVTPTATKSHRFSVIAGERPYHCRACGQRYTQGHQVSHVLCHCRGTPQPLRGVRTALHPGPPSPTCSLSLRGNAPTTAGRVDSVTPRATKSHMFSVITGECPYHCRACGQRYTQGHQVSHVLCHYRGMPLPLRGVWTALHPGPPSPTCSLSLQGNAPTIAWRADSVTPRATKSHMFSVIAGERPYHCGACGQRYTQGHQVRHVLCHCRGTPLPLRTALHPGPPSPTCSLSLQGNATTTAGRVDSVTPTATKSHMFSVMAGERPYHCGACGQRYTQGHQVPHVLCHCRGTPLPLQGVWTALHPRPPSLTCSLSLQGNATTTAGRVDSVTPRATKSHMFSVIAGECPYHCRACGQRYTQGHQVSHVLCHYRGMPLPLQGVWTALHPGPPSLTCSLSLQGNAPTTAGRADSVTPRATKSHSLTLQRNAPTTAGRADSVTPRATKSHRFSVIAGERPYHCGACGQRYTQGHPSLTCSLSLQ